MAIYFLEGGEENVGLHQGEQPAGPQEQADDQVRRQALQGLYVYVGSHYIDSIPTAYNY